jgi:hypothetical protein
MGERAEALARRFEQANGEMITLVEQTSEPAWRLHCEDEGWSVGVTAHHVAANHLLILDSTRALVNGTALPTNTVELSDQFNADHARRHTGCTREETVELLRRNGDTVAAFIRGLNDEQLDQCATIPFFGNAVWTTEQWIENILIGHAGMHMPSIRAAG